MSDLWIGAAFEPHMHHEAAAEITRLRAALATAAGEVKP